MPFDSGRFNKKQDLFRKVVVSKRYIFLVSQLKMTISMKKFLWTVPFIFINSFAGEPVYFPSQIKQSTAPTISVDSDFTQQRVDLTLTTRKPLVGFDDRGKRSIIPEGSSLLLQSTLDQIYSGFKQSPIADSLFSTKDGIETMGIESPDALRMKIMFQQLIQLKLQQQQFDRIGISSSSRYRDELTVVTVKQEGKIKKLKVDLEKAAKEDAIDIGESEVIPYALPTDYDGNDSWTVEKRSEAADIYSIRCVVCAPRKDKLRPQMNNVEAELVNQVILKKYSSYSKDKKTNDMILFAMNHKKSKSTGQCYANIKEALLGSKMIEDRPAGVSPKFAGEQLESRGFTNIMQDDEIGTKIKSPLQAPKGAILVYEPVPANRLILIKEKKNGVLTGRQIWVPDYGHIEIKTEDPGKPGFVSDYFNKKARTGTSMESVDRKLIGIYVKKN